MPSTVIPSAILPRISETPGCLAASSLARALTDGVSSSSLHGGAHRPCSRLPGRALVGDLEYADLLDGVAEELDPQRVLLGRREHVKQPAAHREFAALGHHLDPGVADVDEPRDHVLWVGVVPRGEPHGHQVAEPGHDRLQYRADRRHDDLQRPAKRILCGWVREAAQDGDPLPDGVGTRRQPLMRQRLPSGKRGDQGRRQERAQRRGEVLGLARGRGDREHEPARPARGAGRQRGGEHRAQGRRRDEVALATPGDPEHVGLEVKCGTELGIFGYGGQ